jgi:hypothetical protein
MGSISGIPPNQPQLPSSPEVSEGKCESHKTSYNPSLTQETPNQELSLYEKTALAVNNLALRIFGTVATVAAFGIHLTVGIVRTFALDSEGIKSSFKAAWNAINMTFQNLKDPSSEKIVSALLGESIKDVNIETSSEGVTTLSQSHSSDDGKNEIEESIRMDQKKWVNCNFTRSEYEGVESFKAYADTLESNIPNLAVHQVKVSSKDANGPQTVFSCIRSGAITDARYGVFSLKDLTELKESADNEVKFNQKIGQLVAKIDGLRRKGESNPKALEYLDASKTLLENLREVKNPQPLLDERIEFLKPQFAQLLTKHIQNFDASKLEEGSTFTVAQLGLIHPESKIEKEGIIHDEKVIQEDTHELLKLLNERPIQVDNESSEISIEKDVIKVPRAMFQNLNDEVKNLTLNSFYMNISIQDNKENTEGQKAINQHVIYTFGHEALGISEELKNKITSKKELSQEDALELLESFQVKGLSTGVMCYSGKDRTGFIVAELAKRVTENKINSSVGSMGSIVAGSLAVAVADFNQANPKDKKGTFVEQRSQKYEFENITFLKLKLDALGTISKAIQQAANYVFGYLRGQKAAD